MICPLLMAFSTFETSQEVECKRGVCSWWFAYHPKYVERKGGPEGRCAVLDIARKIGDLKTQITAWKEP